MKLMKPMSKPVLAITRAGHPASGYLFGCSGSCGTACSTGQSCTTCGSSDVNQALVSDKSYSDQSMMHNAGQLATCN